MRTKYIFLFFGAFLIINGLLVLSGVEFPRRDGKIIVDPVSYGKDAIIWGISIIVLTLIILIYKRKK